VMKKNGSVGAGWVDYGKRQSHERFLHIALNPWDIWQKWHVRGRARNGAIILSSSSWMNASAYSVHGDFEVLPVVDHQKANGGESGEGGCAVNPGRCKS
jgi:hypothetical protein